MDPTPLQKAVSWFGTPTALATKIGRKQSTVWDWLNIPGRVPDIEGCKAIERVTDGAVTVAELRPDLAELFRPAAKPAKRRKAA